MNSKFFDTNDYDALKIKTLSILRYPGGKSKIQKQILPFLVEKIRDYNKINFYEPFIGGGSISLTMKYNFTEAKIYLNDLDTRIYQFWNFMVNSTDLDFNILLAMLDINPDIKLYNTLIKQDFNMLDEIDKAFNTVVLNRTSFGGIIGSGPIGGQKQESKWTVDCVYGKNTIKNRILKIRNIYKNGVTVSNENALCIIEKTKNSDMLYLDPPYYKVGHKYYNTFMTTDEHIEMSKILKRKKNWVMSIDDAEEVRDLYSYAKIQSIDCIYNMKTSFKNGSKNKPSTELIITNG